MDKAEFVSPSGPRFRSLGEVDQAPICCFVGPEARLGAMRGDVCVVCLWKSLDGMIWSACRCDVPLHVSGVCVSKVRTYISTLSTIWSTPCRGRRMLHTYCTVYVQSSGRLQKLWWKAEKQ